MFFFSTMTLRWLLNKNSGVQADYDEQERKIKELNEKGDERVETKHKAEIEDLRRLERI